MMDQVWGPNRTAIPASGTLVGNDLNIRPVLGEVPADYNLAIDIPTADGTNRMLAGLPGAVFLEKTVVTVGEARKTLVEYFQALNDAQQRQIDALNAMPVLKPISTALVVPYTASVALLAATTKTITVDAPGVIKDEPIIANPTSMPAGWGFSGVKASAADKLTFTLTLPAIALNGTGACTFAVFAQRKLVS